MGAAVILGAEAWSAPGGPSGALVVHGFTGTPATVRPVAEALAGAGLAVEAPRLPGHGTHIHDMIPTRFADWWAAAEEAYLRLAARCQEVVVAGPGPATGAGGGRRPWGRARWFLSRPGCGSR
ncbi:MAG: hypothetical protein KY438_08255 [Actinobacteria bacterium]|nr:hypothetical protein [Actinomycetota bacterium]